MTTSRPRLVLITGLSGSGKSSVANCFEDLGFYVVDNLPLPLLAPLLADPTGLVEGHEKIAVVTDVRAPGFAERSLLLIGGIDRRRLDFTLLFLEASEESLVRRFSETRRPHPLSREGSVVDTIRQERELLAELRGQADMVLDTSEWSIHETRTQIYRAFAAEPGGEPTMTVSLLSFGFKHGIPQGSDLVFDVRFLPNPHFIPRLRERTGQDPEIVAFLEEQEDFLALLRRLEDLLLFLLPRYRRENRSYLTIAIGCTGGRHRSVAIAERLAASLGRQGWPVRTVHRDLDRRR